MDLDKVLDIPENILDRAKYAYAWSLDDKRYMVMARARGYELVKVTDPEGLKLGAGHPLVRADGTIGIGDAVLMRAPVDVVKERVDARKRRNAGAVAAVKADFHAAGAGLGVRTFEDPTPGS